jgi:photosystem II stability/assembly factor-like uncharacterized protein
VNRPRVSIATLVVLTGSVIAAALITAAGRPPGHGALPGVQGEWVSVGPAPYVRNAFATASLPQVPFSGRIASIAVDPTDLSHWLLGVGNGGVWETRNAGGNWVPLTDGAPTLATGDIAFDPTNPRTIYVGTGEAHGGGLAMCGMGILKSTDGGQTWTLLGSASFARGSVKRLRLNPADPTNMVAASTRGGYGRHQDFPGSPPPYGILVSNDAAQTWRRTLAGQATALEIDPANFDRQYAAIGENVSGQAADAAVNGVYRSSDGGQHWDQITGPWPASSGNQLATGRIELALAPSNSNVVYASISTTDGSRILGLYRTDNAWDTVPSWRQISTAQTAGDLFSNIGPGTYTVTGNYSHVITVSPSDANTVFAGGKVLLWRCSNCGSAPQWQSLPRDGNFDGFADQQATAWAGNRLIIGNDGGIFSSTDLGSNWQNHNAPISTTLFYNGALHPTDRQFMIGGSRDQGFLIRQNGSSTWALPPRPQGLPDWGGEAEVALSSTRPLTDWMAGSLGGQIWRTTDGAKTVKEVDTGISKNTWVYPAAIRKCPSDDNVFLTGTDRLWRTNNFFNSDTPSWAQNSPVGTSLVYAVSFDAADATCSTYAYGSGRSVMLTRDGGRTWKDIGTGSTNTILPVFAVNSIAFDPASRDTLYLAFTGFSTASAKPRHIYKTVNASADQPTWTNISPPEDVPFDVIVVDPRNASLVYAGSDTGLWVSQKAGGSWHKMGPAEGLPHATIYDVKINPVTDQTVVFTYGRGAFEWHEEIKPRRPPSE